MDTYHVAGITRLGGVPAQATLRLYRALDGAFMQETQSDPTTGVYSFTSQLSVGMAVFDNTNLFWDKAKLVVPMDGANDSTIFVDLKGNTLTSAGGAKNSTSQYRYGSASGYFDGADDEIYLSNNALLSDCGSTLTISAWVYPLSYFDYGRPIIAQGQTGGSTDQFFSIASTGQLVFYRGPNLPPSINVSGTTQVPLNQWSFVALQFDGVNVKLFLNDTLQATVADTSGWINSGQPVRIGRHLVVGYPSYQSYFHGYIDDLVVVDDVRFPVGTTPGTSVYSGVLVPGIEYDVLCRYGDGVRHLAHGPVMPVVGGDIRDPDWDSVVLLMPMEGEDNSTVFTNVKNWSVAAVYGNSKLVTAQKKFGASSAYFDGSGDCVYFPASASFGMGTGDFTIEAFVYPTTITGDDRGIIDLRATFQTAGLTLFLDKTTKKLSVWNGSTAFTGGSEIPVNAWTHVAATIASGVLRLFVNGVKVAEVAHTVNLGSSMPVGIGGSGAPANLASSPFLGNIDEVRITKGVARYTANFTPSPEPFPQL